MSRDVMRQGRGGRGDRRVVARYVLFQIPGLLAIGAILYGAVHWFDLAPRYAVLVAALWVVKDAVMFPFVRAAYEVESAGGAEALLGAVGVTKGPLDPGGYVQIGHEAWCAEVAREHAPVPAGARVRVRAVRGLTLEVEPSP